MVAFVRYRMMTPPYIQNQTAKSQTMKNGIPRELYRESRDGSAVEITLNSKGLFKLV